MAVKRKWGKGLALAVAAVVGLPALGLALWAGMGRLIAHSVTPKPDAAPDTAIKVEVVHPRLDVYGFARTITQPVEIRGFYRADLMSHVAGPVKQVTKYAGSPVSAGEVLVELDVPDLWREVTQKEKAVQLAAHEVRAAEKDLAVALAAWQVKKNAIQEKTKLADSKAADVTFLTSEFSRYQEMYAKQTILKSQLAEHQKEKEAAEAEWGSAQAAVESAKSAAAEAESRYHAAEVDIDVKKATQAVAEAELATAQTMADYTVIRAPFDGFVAERHVDPGTYVQAGAGREMPMLTLMRTDIVTAVVWAPEKDAPLVSPATEAVLTLDALPGRVLHTRVSRPSHYLDPKKGRDMEVEIDLYNTANPDYGAGVAAAVGREFAPLAANGLPGAAALLGAAHEREHAQERPLQPGQYGSITLTLQRFDHQPLLPSGAVFTRGGRTCILQVENDKARIVPVRVQYDDGVTAKVVRLTTVADPRSGEPADVAEELKGDEEIVRAGQGEIADGQVVHAITVDWGQSAARR
jgi:multidrug resistance efflux pump